MAEQTPNGDAQVNPNVEMKEESAPEVQSPNSHRRTAANNTFRPLSVRYNQLLQTLFLHLKRPKTQRPVHLTYLWLKDPHLKSQEQPQRRPLQAHLDQAQFLHLR